MRLVRSYAYLACLVLSTAIIGVLGIPFFANRSAARWIAGIWVKTNLLAARWLCGIKTEIRGRENILPGPAIIAAKHQSMWETLVLYDQLPGVRFVLKKELARIPMFGWWCKAVGFIFVDREAGASALRTMLADAKAALAEGASYIVIFPEGTRVAPGESAPYQPGVAALAKSLKLPVLQAAHNSGTYWLTPGPAKLPGTIVLEFLPPLEAGLPREEVTARLESGIEEAVARLEAAARPGQKA